ncbi:MAG: hypothetical protein J3Q66DRAFT_327235 [Benniella sp.]|nr:MAG: hypothetical protein J3Q66DRAFT_327235 [Benniella sp.]
MRPLTLLQKQRITLSLFFTVAVGAVFTVAAPAFVPWQVVDNKRAQALDQQRRQGKDFHVIENRRQAVHHGTGSTTAKENSELDSDTPHPTTADVSSQGPIISLLTDRARLRTSYSVGSDATPVEGTDPSLDSNTTAQDPHAPTKKRRRRRKRKMVNEGWQELTGRTAKEEREKQHTQAKSSTQTTDGPTIGENGGIEITWKNKATPP